MSITGFKRVCEAVAAQKPDIVLVSGDIVDGHIEEEEQYAGLFRKIIPRLGIVAVPGNHDYYEDIGIAESFMKKSGITLLRTSHIEAGGSVIVGADDLDHMTSDPESPDKSRSEALLFKEGGSGKFTVLLRHRPVVEVRTLGKFDVQLSGHTHGGQLFPIPTSRHIIPGRSRGFAGLGDGSWMYVSNGAGFVGPPMRFFAPAEIVVIDLIKA